MGTKASTNAQAKRREAYRRRFDADDTRQDLAAKMSERALLLEDEEEEQRKPLVDRALPHLLGLLRELPNDQVLGLAVRYEVAPAPEDWEAE